MPSRPLTENERSILSNALALFADESERAAARTDNPRLHASFAKSVTETRDLASAIEQTEAITIGVE